MGELWSFWLMLAIGLFIAELLTMSLICIYIGLGALTAMVCALFGGEWIATILTFVISTVVIYFATYHWRHKLIGFLHKESQPAATGMDALIGRSGTVIQASDSLRMKIDGDVWQIVSADDGVDIKAGDKVRVTGYDSIIIKVEKI